MGACASRWGRDTERLAQVLLPIYNSSLHRFRVLGQRPFSLERPFNAKSPISDPPDRADSRSWI